MQTTLINGLSEKMLQTAIASRWSRFVAVAALSLMLPGCGGSKGKATVFEILIENISTESSLTASNGAAVLVAFSPVFAVVHEMESSPLFRVGEPTSNGLESLAEDGDIGSVLESLSFAENVTLTAAVNTPVDAERASPLLPENTYRLLVTAQSVDSKLSFASMFVQSNDVFVATPEGGIALFDAAGAPVSGDITASLALFDAGTEVNQEPGLGADQTPRQAEANQGADEGGVVRPVDDGFFYPAIPAVLRVSINPIGDFEG